MSRKSAGRPKKAGARKPSGDLRPVNDNGTDQLLMQRACLVDEKETRALHLAVINSQAMVALNADDKSVKQATRDIAAARKKIHAMASDRRLSYVLGILYARKTITGGQHYAGNRYAGLYVTSSYRAVRQQSVLGKMVGGENGSTVDATEAEAAKAKQRESYLSARKALLKAGFTAAGIVDSVCVFEQLPLFKQLDDLRKGLDILRDHFEVEGRKR